MSIGALLGDDQDTDKKVFGGVLPRVDEKRIIYTENRWKIGFGVHVHTKCDIKRARVCNTEIFPKRGVVLGEI